MTETETHVTKTYELSQKAFAKLPSLLYELVTEHDLEATSYSWSAHEPFLFTCYTSFPAETLIEVFNAAHIPIIEVSKEETE